ncbi:Methyltransferase domain, partial [Trinorchestia longiramus]
KIPWSEYPIAVHPQEGSLPPSRLQRKCQQLENVVCAVSGLVKPGHKIVDFCAGGGHVGLLIAYKFPDISVLMVENKVSSLKRAKIRAQRLKLTNVEFYQCNLHYFDSPFDVGVCLHACGQATDMVLEKCYRHQAAFVCVPCCYGSVKPNPGLQYPRSLRFQQLLPEVLDYLTLCHAADQTHGADHPSTAQGQLCMRFVDGDRLMHAQQLGYRTSLYLMVPPSCSPKNHILVGI